MKKNPIGVVLFQVILVKFLRMMKLITLILFAFTTSVSAGFYLQEMKISLNAENITVSEIFNEIQKQTGCTIFYFSKDIDVSREISVKFNDEPIEVVLDEVLKGTASSFTISGKDIIIKAKSEDTPKNNSKTENEDKKVTITGIVADAKTNLPIPWGSVYLKGTDEGTITDVDGKYELSFLFKESSVLVFSYIGYKTVEIPINSETEINILLEEDIAGLEEIVVVGYSSTKKASLTGSVGTVSKENLTHRPAANTTELLQGLVAGLVTRQESGIPGADEAILSIRGFGDPLVIVDGIESEFGQIDPNDIESLSILKDASAAIYGARAGNGVILVTTKRGTDKPAQINYHGTVSFVQPTFLPDMVNATKWAELLNESGLDPEDYCPNHISYDPESNQLIDNTDGSVFNGYNWSEELYRNWVPQQQHNLSAQGGNKKAKYYISAGITDQESAFKSGDYDFGRYNVRSNVDVNITKNLSVSVDFSYRKIKLDKANFELYGMYNSLTTAKPVYPIIHEVDPSRATYSGFLQRSPYFETFEDYSGFIENSESIIHGVLQLKYTFPKIKGLSAKIRFNYEEIFSDDKKVSKPFTVWEYDPLAANNGDDPWIYQGIRNNNEMSVSSATYLELMPSIVLEYQRGFGNHGIKAMLVGETQTYNTTQLQGYRKDILSYEAPLLKYASQVGQSNSENIYERARSSFIGRLNYNYSGKYLLEFAIRADASAEYPPEGRWGYFPSISAAWRISEESFVSDNISAIDNLKLRASYGVLGNDAVSSFDYLSGYNITDRSYIFGTTPSPIITSAGIANPDITWETMKISNIGLEGSFWNGLLGFEIDGFYRLREDILAIPSENVPSTFGGDLPKTNLNKRDNRGFEIKLTHYHHIGGFSYHITPIFSWARGKYVKLEEEVLPVTGNLDEETLEFNRLWNERYVQEGGWDDLKWGYLSNGFFMNEQEIEDYEIDQDQNGNRTLKVGDIKYRDLNGDNYIDWRDETVIGKTGLPKKLFSLDLGFRFKGFNLSMLWQGAADYFIKVAGPAAAPFSNESIPLEEHYKYRAVLSVDDNGDNYISNPDDFELPPLYESGGRTDNNSKESDFWNLDTKFLRLKNLYVSYSMPKKLIQFVRLQQCTIYLSFTNLYTISNMGIWKKSFDPEVPLADNRKYPPVRTLTFGLKLTL